MRVSAKTNGHCFYCNKPAEAIDHFISIQKYKDWGLETYIGSPHKLENLVPACNSCNSRKHDKCPEDFIGNAYLAWRRYFRVNWRVGIGIR